MGLDMNRRGFLIGLMSTAAVGAIACAVAAPAMAVVSEPLPVPSTKPTAKVPWPMRESEMWEYDAVTRKYCIAWKVSESEWERYLAQNSMLRPPASQS